MDLNLESISKYRKLSEFSKKNDFVRTHCTSVLLLTV